MTSRKSENRRCASERTSEATIEVERLNGRVVNEEEGEGEEGEGGEEGDGSKGEGTFWNRLGLSTFRRRSSRPKQV
jgi:hypothetical protein